MTQNDANPDLQGNLPTFKTGHANQLTDAMDMLKRDRFELLSAYLDGEVTATERRQVEDWLANEPEVKRLYMRLLQLRQGLRMLPVPPTEQPVEQTIEKVFGRLNRRHYRAMAWGGAAIAALFVSALSSVLPSREFLQIATTPKPAAPAETLKIALNAPLVEIPKAPVAAPEEAAQQTQAR